MGAERMMRFTWKEFLDGTSKMGVASTPDLKAKLPSLRAKLLNDATFFTHVYTFTYQFALEPGQKVLFKEVAIALWRVLLPASFFARINMFLTYVEKRTDLKGIGKDLWNQVLKFARLVDADLRNYEMDSFWPTILDDFVRSARPDLDRV
jgi:DCN1-like protein 1/2